MAGSQPSRTRTATPARRRRLHRAGSYPVIRTVATAVLLGAPSWLFVTVIGLNREVGEAKADRAALAEKVQGLRADAGEHQQDQTKQIDGLRRQIEELQRRLDGETAGTPARCRLLPVQR